MPLTMQGRPIRHPLLVTRVKLVSSPDICSNFESGIRLTRRATIAICKGGSFLLCLQSYTL